MICSAIIEIRRNGEPLRLLVLANATTTGKPATLHLDRVQLLTADGLPFSVSDLAPSEGFEAQEALEEDAVRQLAEVAALPAAARRIAEATGATAPLARALALRAGAS